MTTQKPEETTTSSYCVRLIDGPRDGANVWVDNKWCDIRISIRTASDTAVASTNSSSLENKTRRKIAVYRRTSFITAKMDHYENF